jgi:hypothetical protein
MINSPGNNGSPLQVGTAAGELEWMVVHRGEDAYAETLRH